MNRSPRLRSIGILAAAAILGLSVLTAGASMGGRWCDGSYHRYQIPDDYDGSGCSAILPEWLGIFPWNWDKMETVCIGLCTELDSFWTPAP
jgi:hypothetical protein